MADTTWKQWERKIGKMFWELDEPNPGQNKPRTGDIKGVGADAESKRFVIEVKYTGKDSFRVTRDILSKIEERSRQLNKIPVLAVVLHGGFKAFVLSEDAIKILVPLLKEIEYCAGIDQSDTLKRELVNLKRAISRVLRELDK